MSAFIDIIGCKYGRLTVLRRIQNNLKRTSWLCLCECGRETVAQGYYLRTGHTKSCGCLRSIVTTKMKTIHGYRHTAIYRVWASMLRRCDNPKQQNYRLYGQRGISVCTRWKNFINFLQDMGERPNGMTIDRIDNDGNYEPRNCRWATHKQQSNNSRHNRIVILNGCKQTLQQWIEELKIPRSTVYSRINRGMSYEKAILNL